MYGKIVRMNNRQEKFKPIIIDYSDINKLNNYCFLEVKFKSVKQNCSTNVHTKTKKIPDFNIFDIEKFSDKSSKLAHMMPKHSFFQDFIKKYNLNTNIILHERNGIYSSPRAWWMLTSIGYQNIFILNRASKDL